MMPTVVPIDSRAQQNSAKRTNCSLTRNSENWRFKETPASLTGPVVTALDDTNSNPQLTCSQHESAGGAEVATQDRAKSPGII